MIFEKVKSLLAEQFDVHEEDISMETNLKEDLDADSLDLMDLLSSLEDEFDFEIDITEDEGLLSSITTVEDIVSYISENVDVSLNYGDSYTDSDMDINLESGVDIGSESNDSYTE